MLNQASPQLVLLVLLLLYTNKNNTNGLYDGLTDDGQRAWGLGTEFNVR